jgi:hypothetical protein
MEGTLAHYAPFLLHFPGFPGGNRRFRGPKYGGLHRQFPKLESIATHGAADLCGLLLGMLEAIRTDEPPVSLTRHQRLALKKLDDLRREIAATNRHSNWRIDRSPRKRNWRVLWSRTVQVFEAGALTRG